MPGHFFAYHLITKVPIVLYLVLENVPTNVNEVARYSEIAFTLPLKKASIFITYP